MSKENETTSIICNECGGGYRNHEIIYSHSESWSDPEGLSQGAETYQIIKCFERKPGHALCVFKRPGVCAKSGGKIKPLSALANIGEE